MNWVILTTISGSISNYISKGRKIPSIVLGSILWCSDWYHSNYYSMIGDKKIKDPKGPETSYDPMEPFSEKKVIRGGSFLCNDSYCSGYRNSARMKTTPDSSSLHTGFRTVVSD